MVPVMRSSLVATTVCEAAFMQVAGAAALDVQRVRADQDFV